MGQNLEGGGPGNTMGWSVELCGGTHVRRTGDIGLISGVSDSGVAAGVRRIEALTGTAARKAVNAQVQLAKAAASELKAPLEDLPARLGALLDERKKLERSLSEANQKLALSGGGASSSRPDFVVVSGTKLMVIELKGHDPKSLKALADQAKLKLQSGVVAVANTAPEGAATLVVGVTADLTNRFNAVDLVRKGVEVLGGKGGGGKPDMAQGGGPDGSKAEAALKAIESALGA
jgi:alanyl-tRNA synthetase